MHDHIVRYSLSLVDNRHRLEPDLEEEEFAAIGYVTAQWAHLEHKILASTHPLLGRTVRRILVTRQPGDRTDRPSSVVEETKASGARSEDNFYAALGKLRGVFGQQLAVIAYLYRIDLEHQLASILPPEPKSDD
jgi:hypothetical protein